MSDTNSNLTLLKNLTEQLNLRDENLIRSERQFRGFFENSSAGMCIANSKTGYFVKVNPALCEWLGYTEQELLSRPMTDFVKKSTLQKTEDILKKLSGGMVEETIKNFVNEYEHKDGSSVWLRWNASVPDESGINYSVCANITKELKQDIYIREQEQLFRKLTENSSEAICLHEPDGTYKYCSPSTTNILGWRPKELLGKNPYEFFHVDDIDRISNESHFLALEGQRDICIRYRYRKKNGKYIWVETCTTPIMNSLGEVFELRTVSKDVSSAVKLQEEKTAFETISKTIMQNTHELIKLYSIDKDGVLHVEYISQSSIKYTGYSAKEHQAMPLDELVHPDDFQITMEKMLSILHTKEKITVRYRGKHKTDGYKWAESILTPILNDAGELLYILLSSRIIDKDVKTQETITRKLVHYRDIVESSDNLIIVYNADGKPQWVSPSCLALTGWGNEDVKSKDPKTFIHPDDLEEYEEKLSNTLQYGVQYEMDIRIKTRQRGFRWFKRSLRALINGKGEVQKLISSDQDIHEIKSQELQTERELKVHINFFTQWDVGNYEINWNTKEHVSFSDSYLKIFDIGPDILSDKVTHLVDECVGHSTREAIYKKIEDTISEGKYEFILNYWVCSLKGESKLIINSGMVKKNEADGSLSVVGIVQDVTGIELISEQPINKRK